MYRITLSEQARKEYLYFTQSSNKAILNKIQTLLEDIAEHPYPGWENQNHLNMNWLENGQEESMPSIELFTLYMMI